MLSAADARKALDEAIRTGQRVQRISYTPVDSSENEYCLFLKPELTALGTTFSQAYELVQERLAAFDQHIVAAVALDATYLERHRIMSQHYGVIDTISRNPAEMSDEARTKLASSLGDELSSYSQVGALQFLNEYPMFSAEALAIFYSNLSNIKLAGGTHCVRSNIRGRKVLLFNGFYPEQLEHYARKGASILVLAVRGKTPWREIRRTMTGPTNPQAGPPESIRGTLLRKREALGLSDVRSGRNGVHVSAGPVEAMVEISRYFSDWDLKQQIPFEGTTYGRLLHHSGFSDQDVRKFASNAKIVAGEKQTPIFDVTEEMGGVEAVRQLKVAKHL